MPTTLRAAWGRLKSPTLQIAVPLLAIVGLVCAIAWLGQWAGDRLQGLDRYSIPFAAIDCPAPPGMARADFLTEVQYLGGLPERLPLLDKELPPRLASAFALHPWVETVERVEVQALAEVRVQLVFRTPALLVLPVNRVVDRNGVLLPANAPMKGLPVLTRPGSIPAGAAGMPWGDAEVTAAARARRR